MQMTSMLLLYITECISRWAECRQLTAIPDLPVSAEASKHPRLATLATADFRKHDLERSQTSQSREFIRTSVASITLKNGISRGKTRGQRKRRYAYEDTHVWPDDDSLDYDFDESGEAEELTLLEEIGRNWQVVALRGIFIFAALTMLLVILCCCCKIWCRVCCRSLRDVCIPCRPFLDILGSFTEDPMYKRAKELAELMGLKLDYATYMKIKEKFDAAGPGYGYNPLGLPYMQ